MSHMRSEKHLRDKSSSSEAGKCFNEPGPVNVLEHWYGEVEMDVTSIRARFAINT